MQKTTDQSLTKLADAAFEQAARKVIDRAKQTGTPVIVWEDEAVKELDPQQGFEVHAERAGQGHPGVDQRRRGADG